MVKILIIVFNDDVISEGNVSDVKSEADYESEHAPENYTEIIKVDKKITTDAAAPKLKISKSNISENFVRINLKKRKFSRFNDKKFKNWKRKEYFKRVKQAESTPFFKESSQKLASDDENTFETIDENNDEISLIKLKSRILFHYFRNKRS